MFSLGLGNVLAWVGCCLGGVWSGRFGLRQFGLVWVGLLRVVLLLACCVLLVVFCLLVVVCWLVVFCLLCVVLLVAC